MIFGSDLLATNHLQPVVLTSMLGTIVGFLRSELELPDKVLKLPSIMLGSGIIDPQDDDGGEGDKSGSGKSDSPITGFPA